ncbi:hypothetical protein [Asticcacaulis sp.]|uniref:hypothetical protein n=1 Tax=Asticcacaulis sp. TaxID=1872648 RepID=UPI002B6004B9|nr:hypothetical protein [Asticcacaulis sp.]HTM81128.1 hypothetical protein [Asticcacaulis sp.]
MLTGERDNNVPDEDVFVLSNFLKQPVSRVFGPSHVLRWRNHIRNGVIKSPIPPEHFFGEGGVPIWSKKLFDAACAVSLNSSERIGVLVGDFRFGNKICLNLIEDDTVLQDGYTAIDINAITPDYDREMHNRVLRGLEYWHNHFGKKIRYIFWCLFGRQVQDRLAGHHIINNSYKHPTFNYSELVETLPELDIVDLQPLLHLPMHDVIRLFVDTSLHPSQIGYLLLNNLLFTDLKAVDAYRMAVNDIESELCQFAQEISTRRGRKTIFTGRSIWLDTLVRYLGASGAQKLADAGLVLAPLDHGVGQMPASVIGNSLILSDYDVIVFSAGGRNLGEYLARAFNTPEEAWTDLPCIDWESGTEDIIRARSEKPVFSKQNSNLSHTPQIIKIAALDHMVELGPTGMPSWAGLCHTLKYIASELEAFSFPKQLNYRIAGDALATDNGFAFLIGGGHSIREFASGKMVPTQQSYENFAANIAGRLATAKEIGAPYAHVIFPDKQSILQEEYPFQPVIRLGDNYMERLDSTLQLRTIYPAADLKKMANTAYYPLDTHLTDKGSLEVLRLMLKAVGIKAPDTLAHIDGRIIKPVRWPGDLGSKFTPPLYQDGLLLEPDWKYREFTSPGGFNDGMIDILLNPSALHDKTVLLFGDSFFRMMLRHLSAIFTKVICLRTRFLHNEMISLIQPHYIFTGNAERYLSHVESDSNAYAFSLFPYMRSKPNLALPPDFISAWRAVTSPKSEYSRAYFANINGLTA